MGLLEKKYELIKTHDSGEYYRIRALRNINKYNVKIGQVGGLVEKEENLSQEGDGWIHYTSKAIENACVKNGVLKNESVIKDEAILFHGRVNNSTISGNSEIRQPISIKHSTIHNSVFHTGGTLDGCHIKNVDFIGECYLDEVFISAKIRLQVCDETNWNKVNLQVQKRSAILEKTDWTSVTLHTGRLLVEDTLRMRFASITESESFKILKSEKLRKETWMVQIEGDKDGQFKCVTGEMVCSHSTLKGKILIKGSFRFINTLVTGTAIFQGTCRIQSSKISGQALINVLGGDIIECEVSDMASIHQTNPFATPLMLTNLRLVDDERWMG